MIFTMMINPKVNSQDFENIEVDENKNLILTPEQYIKLADYISELKAENKNLKSQLEQANEELDKAYSDSDNSIDLTQFSKVLTGAGIATLLIILSGNL